MTKKPRLRIGDVLRQYKLATEEQINSALRKQKETKQRLGDILAEDGVVTEEQIAYALSDVLDVPFMTLSPEMIDPESIKAIPPGVLRKHRLVPVLRTGNQLTVAFSDPTDLNVVEAIKRLTGGEVILAVASKRNIEAVLDALIGKEAAGTDREAPVVRTIEGHVDRAMAQGANEILFRSSGDRLSVRFRVGGRFVEEPPQPVELLKDLMDQVGLSADHLASGSATRAPVKASAGEVMLSSFAVQSGSETLLFTRFAPTLDWPRDLAQVGLRPECAARLRHWLSGTGRIVLVCGTPRIRWEVLGALVAEAVPRGATVLAMAHAPSRHVTSFTHVEVHPSTGHGVTEAAYLSAHLCPEAVVVDDLGSFTSSPEQFRRISRAPFCFVGLPCHDARSASTWLAQASRVGLDVQTRLEGLASLQEIRRLCDQCKRRHTPSPAQAEALGQAGIRLDNLAEPAGCPGCGESGYRGTVLTCELASAQDLAAQPPGTALSIQTHSSQLAQLVADGVVAIAEWLARPRGDADAMEKG
jgi:hypothetical protein